MNQSGRVLRCDRTLLFQLVINLYSAPWRVLPESLVQRTFTAGAGLTLHGALVDHRVVVVWESAQMAAV